MVFTTVMHLEGVVLTFDEMLNFVEKECPKTWKWYNEWVEVNEVDTDYAQSGHGEDCECGCLEKTEEERTKELVDDQRYDVSFELLDRVKEEMSPRPKSVIPISAYQAFCREERSKIQDELPKDELTKELAKRWSLVKEDEEEIKKYKKKSDELTDERVKEAASSYKEKVSLPTWPCCSNLAYNKFVVGRNILKKDKKASIDKIFNEVVIATGVETDPLTDEEKERLDPYGPIQVVLMLDDCTSCT